MMRFLIWKMEHVPLMGDFVSSITEDIHDVESIQR